MNSTEQTREVAGKTESQIRLHPETHDQETWVSICGTTACAAGWACKVAGLHEFHVNDGSRDAFHPAMQYYVTNQHGVREFIGVTASKLLGLNNDEQEWLFSPIRTYGEVLDGLIALREGDQAKLSDLIEEEGEWA